MTNFKDGRENERSGADCELTARLLKYKRTQQNKSALTTPPVALIFLFSHSISYHWERGEGRVILLGQIIRPSEDIYTDIS